MGKIDRSDIYRTITEKYAGTLLRWAVKKTGSRQDGEDLAQETLLQVFIYLEKGNEIREKENFIWKVAHHVWCNYLRKIKHANDIMPLDEGIPDNHNVIDELDEADSLKSEITRMRRSIADLSRNQREAMILHYLDGLSVRQVADKLDITESAVKKHLFDARNKIRGESREMKTDTSYVYRPGRLALGVSGLLPDEPDTVKVNDNLIKQNLLLLCSREPRTIDELVGVTGVPKPYMEPELDWLASREFLSFTAKKYSTIIPIIGKKHRQEIGELYDSGAGKKLIDTVIENLQKKEADIRKIGFYGSDFNMKRLLWPVIMLFISYFSRNEEITHRSKNHNDREIRPDGGRYFVIGNDLSDGQDIKPDGYFKPEGWSNFYGIVSDINSAEGKTETYYWLGLYNFSEKKYQPDIINEDNERVRKIWRGMYYSLIESGFSIESLTGDEKEMLTAAIQAKYVTGDGENYHPVFVILTPEQLKRLQDDIFKPLLEKITPELVKLYGIISAMHIKNMPKINKSDVNFLTYLDLWYFGIHVYISAAADGFLYIPDTPEEGSPLTLVLIK